MDAEERLKVLRSILAEVRARQDEICAAVAQDLGRSEHETHISEIVVVKEEIKLFLKQLKKWLRPVRLNTPFQLLPGYSRQVFEPLGKVLVIAPWNFPFHLSLVPATGALAAGNTVVIKPSALAPASSALLARIINDNIRSPYIRVEEGGDEKGAELIASGFDLVFFTGGTAKGKGVYKQAAEHMVPVVLELGGKNPLIFHRDADPEIIKRIVWGKLMNAGQTCLSPDYAFVHESVLNTFYDRYAQYVRQFYGERPTENDRYARIVNQAHFNRISALLTEGKPILGGQADAHTQKIAPTVSELSLSGLADALPMQEEIFGPLLPVIPYKDVEEATRFIQKMAAPLVVYLFSRDRGLVRKVQEETVSGAVCVNDCLMHGANPKFAFGGVGQSGIGKYHGYHSLVAFSNRKSVYVRKGRFDLTPRFPPISKKMFSILKRL